MQSIKLAFLNLSREKKRTLLLSGAIGLGLFILCFVLSLSNGIKRNVQQNVGNILSGHIFIHRLERNEQGRVLNYIEDDGPLLDLLERSGLEIQGIHRRSYLERARFIFQGQTVYSPVEGIVLEEELENLSAQLPLIAGSMEGLKDPRGIAISAGLQRELNVEINDSLMLQFQTIHGQQNVGDFVVKAVYELPGVQGEWASNYCDIRWLNPLLNLPESGYMNLAILLKDLNQLDRSTGILEDLLREDFPLLDQEGFQFSLGDDIQFAYRDQQGEEWTGEVYEVLDLNDLVGFVDELLGVINLVSYGLLVLLLGLILLGIQNTYRLILKERMGEIGTFRALGMYRRDIALLFFLEPVFLTLLGAMGGIVLALAGGKLLSMATFSNQGLFSLFLNQGHPPFSPPLEWILGALVLVLLFTSLSVTNLASKAAKLSPTEAFRQL